MTDIEETFALELARVSRSWRARLDERLRHTGLTQARWMALLVLSRAERRLTQRELAKRIGIEGPTLVRLVDALEQQGLVVRCPVESDRRAHHVCLTEIAAPILAEIDRIAAGLRHELLEGLSDRDIRTCVAALQLINARLDNP